MKVDYFERQLRLTHFEVWKVRVEEREYSLVIEDQFRPAQFADLGMPDLIFEGDDQRSNLVTAHYYSAHPVKEEHREVLGEFARMLTEHMALAHCHVIIDMVQGNPISEVACRLMSYGSMEEDIPLEKLWHFNQE